MIKIDQIIAEHPFFKGLEKEYLDLLAGCASNVRFEEGEYLAHDGDDIKHFFLIREGRVALQINTPQRGAIVIQTIQPGEVLNWSWLIPPYSSYFGARALEEVSAVALSVYCIREKCAQDPLLDYQIIRRFFPIIANRVRATRMQLLDLYSN